jgi:uncharacterized membrane protein
VAIVLALLAAAGWGSSDYAAGVASRRSAAVSVVILTHLVAALVLGVLVLDPTLLGEFGVSFRYGDPGDGGASTLGLDVKLPAEGPSVAPQADLLWGAAAGISGGLGAMLLFRGLARGSMNVVAPITAVGAALLPVGFGLATGESLGLVGLSAVAVALVAVLLISEPGPSPSPAPALVPDGAGGPPALAARAVPWRLHDVQLDPRPRQVMLLAAAAASLAAVAAILPVAVRLQRDGSAGVDGALGLALGALALVAAGMALASQPRRRPAHARRPLGFLRRGGVRARGGGRLSQPGVPEAAGAGLGFGGFYLLLGQTGGSAGLWPLLSARSASVLFFSVAALVSRERLLPQQGDRRAVVIAGVLDAAAAALFLAATRHGLLSVVAVLASLYPAATIALARVFDKERCARHQWAGMGLAGLAVGVLAVS